MAKEQKTSVDFNRTAIVPDFQLCYQPISTTVMIRYTNHLFHQDELYHIFDYMHQVMPKNLDRKPELRREFWGILGKKINSTIKAIFRLDNASLRIKILILSKCNFNTFLSNELSFEEISWTNTPHISYNLAQNWSRV